MSKVKGKKGKKAEELEAARLAAAEEAARLEDERLRIEEEERIRDEAETSERRKLESERLAVETARLAEEAEAIAPQLGKRKADLEYAHAASDADVEWDRYISCVPRPDPRHEREVNGYVITVKERPFLAAELQVELEAVLRTCQDNELIVSEVTVAALSASNFGRKDVKQQQQVYTDEVRALSAAQIDRVTAHVLQHADEVQNLKNEVQVHASVEQFRFGLWVNLAKNPRFKTISIPEIGFVSELPKSLALASIAVRMLHVHYDEFTRFATNEFMSVGGIFTVDLLALPPLPKKVKGWTLRMVTPLASNVQKLPYPIPPAGGEIPATAAVAPPPMGITYPLPSHVVVLESNPKVGWWDEKQQEWRTDGVTEVKYHSDAHALSFHTGKLTSLGMLVSRIKLLPYSQWIFRPTSETTGVLSVTPEENPFPEPISFLVSDAGCRLESPNLPALEYLTTEDRSATLLLKCLSDSGVHLLPEDRDADFAGIQPKLGEVEEPLCMDLSRLASTFMMASSVWNKEQGERDCIVRLSEQADYSRCEHRDAVKVFGKEKGNVVTVLKKQKGCALLPIKDSDPEMPEKMITQITPWDSISWQHEECQPLRFSHNLAVLLKDNSMIQPETLDKIETASPTFSECLEHLMYSLRLFSFG